LLTNILLYEYITKTANPGEHNPMTVLTWPQAATRRPAKSLRKMIIDPLPKSVLHHFVNEIPGPKDETETERAARFEVQLAEVLSFHPRDAAEAMMATKCVLLRLVAEDCHRDAVRPGVAAAVAKKFLRNAKQFDQLIKEARQTLERYQSQPPVKIDPAFGVALGLALGVEPFLVPDPDDPDQAEEPVSAIIVPLHPAPKMLQ
jgi:hypothetical protein